MGRPKGSKNKPKTPPPTDPMAALAPAHVFTERDDTKGPEIVVKETYFDPKARTPGVGAHGYILDHNMYITPDPEMDYRFCTNDSRRVGRNRAKAWQNVTVEGKSVIVGNMTLCQRPKHIGASFRRELENRALAQAHKAKADTIVSQHPSLEGEETSTKQTFEQKL